MTKSGIELIKRYEGCRLTAYRDCGYGIYTIGYGHTKGVTAGQTITKEQAEQMLIEDLTQYERYVDEYISISLTPEQHSALTSLIYNIGAGNFKRSSLRKAINTNAPKEQIERCWMMWIFSNGKKLRGLENRRKAELKLYFS